MIYKTKLLMLLINLKNTFNNSTYLFVNRIVDDDERDRLQIAAQIILTISLFLTATILFILFWKSCARYLVYIHLICEYSYHLPIYNKCIPKSKFNDLSMKITSYSDGRVNHNCYNSYNANVLICE